MRTIKFRGKRIDNGEWVYGFYYYKWRTRQYVIHFDVSQCVTVDNEVEVDPETVGQFTGLEDKNGADIFEGDIVMKIETIYNEDDTESSILKIDVVVMDRFPRFWLKNENFGYEGEDLQYNEHYEIIGNIHDNHELLKQENI